MVLAEFIILMVTLAGLFIWNRAEGRADIHHMDQKLDIMRELIHEVHKETNNNIVGMREEMKDFHGRLVAIEERKLGLYGQDLRTTTKQI